MTFVRPRLNDHCDLGFTQEEVDFAIPFLDEDIALYADPFLLWKSLSQQDMALPTALISSFNHLGYLVNTGREQEALHSLITMSECREAGLGLARNKQGHKISQKTATQILTHFQTIPHVKRGEADHSRNRIVEK
jgi:hypothetical protein